MEGVKKTFKVNVANAKELLLNVIPRIASEKWAEITKEREVLINYNLLYRFNGTYCCHICHILW